MDLFLEMLKKNEFIKKKEQSEDKGICFTVVNFLK